jgi:hypothetical protein
MEQGPVSKSKKIVLWNLVTRRPNSVAAEKSPLMNFSKPCGTVPVVARVIMNNLEV